MSRKTNRALLGIGLAGLILDIVARPALAVDKVSLFKVTTPRGEIVIGLTHEELGQMKGHDADTVARALGEKGTMNVWQYALRKTNSGELQHAPQKNIALQWRDAIRVESYPTRTKVVAIGDYTMKP